jgi:hypothetical protein
MNWKTSVLIKELMKFTDFSYLDSMCQSGKGQPKISNERSGPKNLS